MKYCGKCGFRTTENMGRCICCEALLSEGEGNVSRTAWNGMKAAEGSLSSIKIDIGQIKGQLLRLLIPLALIVAVNVKRDDIQGKMREIRDKKINETIETAKTEAEAGNWYQAMETVSKAMDKYEGNEALQSAYQNLLNAKPTPLSEVECTDSSGVTYGHADQDYFNNAYDGAVRFDTSENAYGEYNVLGKYSQFSGEIHIPTVASEGKSMWIQIYADGALIYERYNITELMEPKFFNVDIEGITSMSIVTGNNGSYDCGFLDLTNTYLGIRKEEIEETEARNAPHLIFPDSNSRYLDRSELEGLSKGACRLARNEIYARYGRIFQDPELKDHFYGFEWYSPAVKAEDFNEGWLNEFEVANRDLIVSYEEEMGYR